MSYQARAALVASRNTIFQKDSQRSDLLDENLTQTGLIEVLSELCIVGDVPFEFTAVKSDHHNDSDLGERCHFNGFCADGWFLNSPTAGDYMDANDPRFQANLAKLAAIRARYQTGLAGSAYTSANVAAAGRDVFQDSGADHIHIGAQNP